MWCKGGVRGWCEGVVLRVGGVIGVGDGVRFLSEGWCEGVV